MSEELAQAEIIKPQRPSLVIDLVLVVLVSTAVLVPGIWNYSLVDPWETHYGEVAREMLENNDFVHTKWAGTSSGSPGDNEGFRSKPVLMFWMMAAGMQTFGVGDRGGYSGEMTQDAWTMVGMRVPFIASAICGLVLLWWMLARLVSRRAAWLSLLVVGSAPMFCLIARQAIPDMPMVACTMGALALLVLAIEDGDRPLAPLRYLRKGRLAIDARHIVLGIAGGCVVIQAVYYALYFNASPILAVRSVLPSPALWLPLVMLLFLGGMSRDGWLIVRCIPVLLGGVIAAIVNEPMPARRPGQTLWRHVLDDILTPWERHGVDRYLVRAVVSPIAYLLGDDWDATNRYADRILTMAPLTSMRQVFMIACYFVLAIGILAKGPPGFTVVAGVGALYVILMWKWRDLWEGGFEIKRGLLLMLAVAAPWHLAMFFKEGARFFDEYIYTHIINRAAAGVDNSPGTFAWLSAGGGGYTSQLGFGMWIWAALLPAAVAVAFVRSNRETREGRVRFYMGMWAIVAVFVFCFVQTKFHHYILPAVPPLAVLVGLFLDDVWARRERLHALYAALGAGIVLLICRDLMHEPERWIEMFVYRYDRPWPNAEPWQIDVSDGVLGLGIAAALAMVIAGTRLARTGVIALGAVGLVIAIWVLQVYMPHAGTHWGMRDAVRTYYEQRTIYGHKTVVFGPGQCVDQWKHAPVTWKFATFIPDNLQLHQPMTIRLQINKASDERIMEQELGLDGSVIAIGEHEVTVMLNPNEREKLQQLVGECIRRVKEYERARDSYDKASSNDRRSGRVKAPERIRGRPPVRAVDADRLIAWQLYWRGENFWSGGEIWAWLPEMKTSFVNPNNVEFQKYIGDRTRSIVGRRYFIVTEAGRIMSARSVLPTQRARDSYEVLDATSNKFSIAAFYL